MQPHTDAQLPKHYPTHYAQSSQLNWMFITLWGIQLFNILINQICFSSSISKTKQLTAISHNKMFIKTFITVHSQSIQGWLDHEWKHIFCFAHICITNGCSAVTAHTSCVVKTSYVTPNADCQLQNLWNGLQPIYMHSCSKIESLISFWIQGNVQKILCTRVVKFLPCT